MSLAVATATSHQSSTEVAERLGHQHPYNVVVWNDPVNLMSYVSYIFRSYFGFSQAKAHQLMLQVHNEGKAIVASGSEEKAQADVAAMHGYGLWATYEVAEA